jgi:hypothetical protein
MWRILSSSFVGSVSLLRTKWYFAQKMHSLKSNKITVSVYWKQKEKSLILWAPTRLGLSCKRNCVYIPKCKLLVRYLTQFCDFSLCVSVLFVVSTQTIECLQIIGYNRPTLCTDYHSFIYYSGSYMFQHLCAIFRERPLSLWVNFNPLAPELFLKF